MQNATFDHLPKRLQQQLKFIFEIDKIKQIFRKTKLLDKTRRENDAEHSWHLAMMVIVFSEYGAANLDLLKVIKMVLLHDIVEIDAGDMFIYGSDANFETKAILELEAAKRIYGILPQDQGNELMNLWQEFEERETPEAKFAVALDRLQPMLLNCLTEGGTWAEFEVTLDKVQQSQDMIKDASIPLWDLINSLTVQMYQKNITSN